MKKGLSKKFWAALAVFGLLGQVAWVVENMYFNVFIYKMFHASAADISLMVQASSVAATVTTIAVGAFSDYIGKRKIMICGGYLAWGISIISFAFIRVDLLTPIAGSTLAAASLGITLVILMDCVMTFFGSAANDACFNAWMTDWGNENNRGRIEGINSMMPLVAILVVFGGFMPFDLEKPQSWTVIFLIVGIAVSVLGILGIFLIDEKQTEPAAETSGYRKNLVYSFRPSVIRENPLLYGVILAFAVFCISINTYMPYLILYYEKSLGMTNYVLILAPAIILAAIITAFYGKLYDLMGFQSSVLPSVGLLMAGYLLLYAGSKTWIVFLGSLLMMTGYLTGMAVFGAMIRSRIPEKKAGQFQGIRIIGQVLIPGIAGPALGAYVLRNAEQIVNSDGTTSFLPNRNIFLAALVVAVVLLVVLAVIFSVIRKGHYQLLSRAGEELLQSGTKEVWNPYPRPQLRRESFQSLNGSWKLGQKEILVPFAPQSRLSGYRGKVGAYLIYTRSFLLDDAIKSQSRNGDRILLHFGAVDQIAEVSLNGRYLGNHRGGYLPFEFDITDKIQPDQENTLSVKVTDTLSARYPYGKQRKKRGGMWYTPVSGIWQSVWLECVPDHYIRDLKITADTCKVTITVESSRDTEKAAEEPFTAAIELHDGTVYEKTVETGTLTIDLTQIPKEDGTCYQPLLWSPDHPFLYPVTVRMGKDTVSSYFGMRTVEIKQTDGLPRVCLNGEPVFLHGVLDQGYYCDGIYLPAEEEEYEKDILRMQELGINLLRKHIKVEPECFYYYCDLHGMLVMQDMVNSGHYSWIRDTALPTIGICPKGKGAFLGSKKRKDFFLEHMKATIMHLHNHPCVIAYTIFNEGWGQFDSDEVYHMAKNMDDTRLYDTASGWFSGKESDFDSQHIYFRPLVIPEKVEKPVLISEFGGFTCEKPGHVYAKYSQYGYGGCKDEKVLMEQVDLLYNKTVLPQIPRGVCGAIYTQLSDVEDELNGFYTYDRKICKADQNLMQKISLKLKEAMQTQKE